MTTNTPTQSIIPNERPVTIPGDIIHEILQGKRTQYEVPLKYSFNPHKESDIQIQLLKSPFGVKGDILWVRETFGFGNRPCPFKGWVDGVEYKADEALVVDPSDDLPLKVVELPDDFDETEFKPGWNPASKMPKWATRLKLEILDIKLERLVDINRHSAFESPWQWVIEFRQVK